MGDNESRRPLKSRNTSWAKLCASWLLRHNIQPNTISVLSVFFALGAAIALCASAKELAEPGCRLWCLVGAVAGIGGRLLCNLFDGMVAVEGGKKTPTGELYNDIPDRISDILIFVGLGRAATAGAIDASCWSQMGWIVACLAVFTAYLRYLGAACGTKHYFLGPGAKQHRMAATIAATIATAVLEPGVVPLGDCYRAGLCFILVATIISAIRRTLRIASVLKAPKA